MKNEDKQPNNDDPDIVEVCDFENNRRKLMIKLAVGTFVVPAVLATLSTTAAHASG